MSIRAWAYMYVAVDVQRKTCFDSSPSLVCLFLNSLKKSQRASSN